MDYLDLIRSDEFLKSVVSHAFGVGPELEELYLRSSLAGDFVHIYYEDGEVKMEAVNPRHSKAHTAA